MRTSHVMPPDTISIEIIKYRNTGLVFAALALFPVIGLRDPTSACIGPITEVAFVFGLNFGPAGGPEPAVDDVRGQIGAIAALEVAFPASGPNVPQTI